MEQLRYAAYWPDSIPGPVSFRLYYRSLVVANEEEGKKNVEGKE